MVFKFVTLNDYVIKFIKTDENLNEINAMVKLLQLQNNKNTCDNIVNIFMIYISNNDINCFGSEHVYKKLNVQMNITETTKMSFIIMEKYDGNLMNQDFENDIFLNDMLNALTYMKNNNMSHNDITRNNIVYKKYNGKIKYVLIDFGIATNDKNDCLKQQINKIQKNMTICNGAQSFLIDLFAVVDLMHIDDNIKSDTLLYICCKNISYNISMTKQENQMYINYQNMLVILFMMTQNLQMKIYCINTSMDIFILNKQNLREHMSIIYKIINVGRVDDRIKKYLESYDIGQEKEEQHASQYDNDDIEQFNRGR